MPLYRIFRHRDLVQRVERNVTTGRIFKTVQPFTILQQIHQCDDRPNIVVSVAEEFAQNIDSHHPETAICFDFKNRQNCLV